MHHPRTLSGARFSLEVYCVNAALIGTEVELGKFRSMNMRSHPPVLMGKGDESSTRTSVHLYSCRVVASTPYLRAKLAQITERPLCYGKNRSENDEERSNPQGPVFPTACVPNSSTPS